MFTFLNKNIFLVILCGFSTCFGMNVDSKKATLAVRNEQDLIVIVHSFDRTVRGSETSSIQPIGLNQVVTFDKKHAGWVYDMYCMCDGKQTYIGSLREPGTYVLHNELYVQKTTKKNFPFVGITHCLICPDSKTICKACQVAGMVCLKQRSPKPLFNISLNDNGPMFYRLGMQEN